MLKKLYPTLIVLLSLMSINVTSQCVIDTSLTTEGMYPDAGTGLPHAIVGDAYSEDLQIVVPDDYSGFSIDHLTVTSITGLPSGFSSACNPSNCEIQGSSTGCVLISGSAPTTQMVGTYPVTVYYTTTVDLGFSTYDYADSTKDYSIIIDNITGINNYTIYDKGTHLIAKQNEMSISTYSNEDKSVIISFYSILGVKVFEQPLHITKGNHQYTFNHNLIKGIYFMNINGTSETIKFYLP